MTENIISMKKIDKFYDDFHVLKGIDFRKSILKVFKFLKFLRSVLKTIQFLLNLIFEIFIVIEFVIVKL